VWTATIQQNFCYVIVVVLYLHCTCADRFRWASLAGRRLKLIYRHSFRIESQQLPSHVCVLSWWVVYIEWFVFTATVTITWRLTSITWLYVTLALPLQQRASSTCVQSCESPPWSRLSRLASCEVKSCFVQVSGVARLWSQGGHRAFEGRKSPAESRGGAPVGVPQKPDIYTNNLQLLNAFLCRSVAESVLHLPVTPPPPPPPKKTLRICTNPMTQHVPPASTLGYATGPSRR